MDAHPNTDEAVRRARAALDPVPVPAASLSARGGGDERGQVLWCAAYDDLARERAGMTRREHEPSVDVMVDVHRDAGPWRVTGALVGSRVDDALPELADLLARLLRAT